MPNAERSPAREALVGKLKAFSRGLLDSVYQKLAEKNGLKLQELRVGKMGVDLSVESNNLRSQCQLAPSALQSAAGRNCLELGGVWIDDQFDAKMPTVVIKCMGSAYFRILELQPQLKAVFKLGNHLVWVAPSGTALIIDTSEGKESLSDEEIGKLFAPKK